MVQKKIEGASQFRDRTLNEIQTQLVPALLADTNTGRNVVIKKSPDKALMHEIWNTRAWG